MSISIVFFFSLYKASTHMKEQLLEASEMQNVVLQKQREGLEIQNHLLNHGLKLEDIIQNSAETVNNIVTDFKYVLNLL